MSKLREDLSIVLLGAAAGLFSSTITVLIDRINVYYAYLSAIDRSDCFYHERELRELWWILPSFWHVVLSILAACLVHRYLKNSFKSPFLLWLVVGTGAMFGWVLTFLVALGLHAVINGDLRPLEHALTPEKLTDIAKFASAIFACNVIYSSVINAASRQYVEHIDPI